MQRVAKLAEAASCAPPSPELCLIAGLVVSLTQGKPKEVTRLVTSMRRFTDAQREMASVVRIRGAEYDEDVLLAMGQATLWLERMEPFLLMMSKR